MFTLITQNAAPESLCLNTNRLCLRDTVSGWEYQLSSERKFNYFYYWSLSPAPDLFLSLSVLSVCFYFFLSASSFSTSTYNLSVSSLICRSSHSSPVFLSTLISFSSSSFFFCPSLPVVLTLRMFFFFEEYNPLPHPPPLRKP